MDDVALSVDGRLVHGCPPGANSCKAKKSFIGRFYWPAFLACLAFVPQGFAHGVHHADVQPPDAHVEGGHTSHDHWCGHDEAVREYQQYQAQAAPGSEEFTHRRAREKSQNTSRRRMLQATARPFTVHFEYQIGPWTSAEDSTYLTELLMPAAAAVLGRAMWVCFLVCCPLLSLQCCCRVTGESCPRWAPTLVEEQRA